MPEIIGGVYAAGPSTPYVSPGMLLNWPTGISWATIPGFNASLDQQYVVAAQLANSATASVDEYLEVQPRATINTETLYGPNYNERLTTLPASGVARALLSCPPVLYAVSGQVQATSAIGSTNNQSLQQIPVGNMVPEVPIRGVYGTSAPSAVGEVGQGMLITGNFVNWWNGRGGQQLTIQYANGWPHCSLTAGVLAGHNQVVVDDITAWVNPNTNQGALGTIYDADASLQEIATVQSVTPSISGAISGPGTLTLTGNLSNSHSAGTIFTALPMTIITATIYFATARALLRGATATSMPTLSGAGIGGVVHSPEDLSSEAELMIRGYRRSR